MARGTHLKQVFLEGIAENASLEAAAERGQGLSSMEVEGGNALNGGNRDCQGPAAGRVCVLWKKQL